MQNSNYQIKVELIISANYREPVILIIKQRFADYREFLAILGLYTTSCMQV